MGILRRIIVPLSTAAIATVGLYYAVFFWNDWFNSLIYLNKEQYPVMLFLRNIVNGTAMVGDGAGSADKSSWVLPSSLPLSLFQPCPSSSCIPSCKNTSSRALLSAVSRLMPAAQQAGSTPAKCEELFMVKLDHISTEQRNPATSHIDEVSTLEIVRLMNQEDKKVAEAVEVVLPQIAAAVDVIYTALQKGGRLIYCGCGTSGRLGVLDAAECLPTFSAGRDMVDAVIAGGQRAMLIPVEGAEDNRNLGKEDLEKLNFSQKDVLCGIAASGRTPYVLGAMEYAHSLGAAVISVTCCPAVR